MTKQDEREQQIRRQEECGLPILAGEVGYLLSLLDAERKRVQELEGVLRHIQELGEAVYDEGWGMGCGKTIARLAESLLPKEQTK